MRSVYAGHNNGDCACDVCPLSYDDALHHALLRDGDLLSVRNHAHLYDVYPYDVCQDIQDGVRHVILDDVPPPRHVNQHLPSAATLLIFSTLSSSA